MSDDSENMARSVDDESSMRELTAGFESRLKLYGNHSESSTKWEGADFPNVGECLKESKQMYISESKKYCISLGGCPWMTKGNRIDLIAVVQHLPAFIMQVGQRSTPFDELREACKRSLSTNSTPNDSYTPPKGESPYLSQCSDEVKRKLPTSKRKKVPAETNATPLFEAYSLPHPTGDVTRNIRYIDCEYILDVHVPMSAVNESLIHRLTDPSTYCSGNHMQRWIFIPSYLRANCGLFNWTESGVDLTKTNQIIVVIPSQFEAYISKCGHALPILCLPQDVPGIGYARHWILKIAMRLGLEYVWMIDDSVSWFYEYSCPGKHVEGGEPRLNFELAPKKIEDIAQSDKCKEHLAAIGPSRWRGTYKASKRFTYKPPQIAVYLNLSLIKIHQVQYRPELEKMEDMVFGAECILRSQGKLTMCRCNEVVVYDLLWKNTGAASPYFERPQDKTTSLPDSHPGTPKSRGVSDSQLGTPKSRGVQHKPGKLPLKGED